MKRLLDGLCGLLAAVALFAIMALTLVDVAGRKLLNHSIPGSLELTEILMVVVIFAALPLVSLHGEHVVFDSLDQLMPPWLRRLQQAVVDLFCAAALGGAGLADVGQGGADGQLRRHHRPAAAAAGAVCAADGGAVRRDGAGASAADAAARQPPPHRCG